MTEPEKKEATQNLDAHPEMRDIAIVLTVLFALGLLALGLLK